MIQDHMNTDFYLLTETETQTNGRLVRSFASTGPFLCAIFTPATAKTVRFGKRDFIIAKNLYCALDVTINLGDYVTVDGADYDVIYKQNTNNLDHHLTIGLVGRES